MKLSVFLCFIATVVSTGCGRDTSSSDSPTTDKTGRSEPGRGEPPTAEQKQGTVDTKGLPGEGAGDPALTYDRVKADIPKYRGTRVTWSFAPLSTKGKRMMCALNRNDAIGPRHAGIYVVEFASDREAGAAFRAAAFQPGSTLTGTIAGPVDQFLVVRGRDGVPQKDIPKVTVPLLLYPAYQAGESGGGKGKGKG